MCIHSQIQSSEIVTEIYFEKSLQDMLLQFEIVKILHMLKPVLL